MDTVSWLFEHTPGAADLVTAEGSNLLHLAACSYSEEVVDYIAERLPADAIRQRNGQGELPLHFAVCKPNAAVLRTIYERYPEAVKLPDNHGNFPLHSLFHTQQEECGQEVCMLRMLLSWYPDAVAIRNHPILEDDDDNPGDETPWEICIRNEWPRAALRLLLNACPSAHPAMRRQLNYEARRGALFLLLAAQPADPEQPAELLRRLRGLVSAHGRDMPLIRHIVSFL